MLIVGTAIGAAASCAATGAPANRASAAGSSNVACLTPIIATVLIRPARGPGQSFSVSRVPTMSRPGFWLLKIRAWLRCVHWNSALRRGST